MNDDPLPSTERDDEVQPLVPARMLCEYTYCPRLGCLMWAQAEFADSADTVEGRHVHRRVDVESGDLPKPGDPERPEWTTRSVMLSSDRLGLIARIDLLEGEGDRITPVDYKRGEAPDLPEGAWEPERVQLCAQGLLLREHGYVCNGGIVYYAASRRRVEVPFDDALVERTLSLLEQFRTAAALPWLPPPLVDSPRCPRCSLVGICLPDETNLLRLSAPAHDLEVRRLTPARPDTQPLYVQDQGAYLSKSGETLVIKVKSAKVAEAKLYDISQVCVFGAVQMSTQVIQTLCGEGIPICYFSHGGWFYGITVGLGNKNIDLRRAQFAAAADPDRCLRIARTIVRDKIANCRTMLRRNCEPVPNQALDQLRHWIDRAGTAADLASLLGIEGMAARVYFQHLNGMLRPTDGTTAEFEVTNRNRRPPKDPTNAMLSYAYSLLCKDCMIALLAVGFDPYLGFYHQPRYGRPALALDLMENFRPLIADSAVIGAINKGKIHADDFVRANASVAFKSAGRVNFLDAYEQRMGEMVTHPVFGYRLSYRRLLEVQARMLGRYLMGELPDPPEFRTR